MAAYRHCPGCGRAFDQKAYQRESFCGSCGEPLKTSLRRDEPLQVDPYPENAPPKKLHIPLNELLRELEQLVKIHPIIGGISAIGIGVGCIAVAPVLISIATGLAWIGGLITSCSFLLAGYDERRSDAEKGIALGLLILCGALLLVVASYLLAALGIAGVAGGSAIAGKATVEAILRKRIESQLKAKTVKELIDLSRQLS